MRRMRWWRFPARELSVCAESEASAMRKNSVKNTRINSEVQKELSEIISRELKDPRIHPMTSVVSAEVTPDLKYCKAYISVLGSEEEAKETLRGLRSAVGFIRTQLARRVNLRNTPELTFILDQSIEYGVHMTRLIDQVAAALPGEDEAEDPDAGTDGEETAGGAGAEADEAKRQDK